MANGYSVPVPQGAPYRPSAPSRPETIAEVFNRTIEENVRRFGGPHLSAALFGSQAGDLGAGQPARGGIVPGMAELSPGADVRDLLQGGGQFMRGTANLSPTDLLGGAGLMGAATLGMAIPGSAGGVRQAVNEVAEEVAPQGIRAWHSSPHEFDQFSMENIGTGEGAQAYGHGLYFAENPKVSGPGGEYYNKFTNQLRRGNDLNSIFDKLKIGGRPLKEEYDIDLMDELVDLADKGDSAEVQSFLNKRLDGWRQYASDPEYPFPDYAADKVDAYQRLTRDVAAGESITLPKATAYEVNIRANPEDFLDWDKPLSEQSAGIQKAYDEFLKTAPPEATRGGQFKDPKGFDFLGAWSEADPAAAKWDDLSYMENFSNYLRERGIPGIRYLDQGSRDAAEGSRNYVTFSDDIVEILRKYGIVAPVAGGAAAGLMGGSGEAEAQPLGLAAASRPAL